VRLVRWRTFTPPGIGHLVELRNDKPVWLPEVSARLAEADYSGAPIVHPCAMKYVKLRADREAVPPMAFQIRKIWGACIDIRSGADLQGVHCALCESSISGMTLASPDEVVVPCPFCCLAFHTCCGRALGAHVRASFQHAAASSTAPATAPALPAPPVAVPHEPPPAGISNAIWQARLCPACTACMRCA